MKRLLFSLLGTCALHIIVSAHVLDQYLQAAQIALAPDAVRIELRLIPGVQVADRICTLIDLDDDGQITAAEEQAYAGRVLQDIKLSISGINIPLTLTERKFPTQPEMREGVGTIRLTFAAATTLGVATHQQLYFRNNHLPELGVYLVNALVPTTNKIKLGEQERDPLQQGLRLAYDTTSGSTALMWRGIALLLFCLGLPLWGYWYYFLRRANKSVIGSEESVT